MPLAFTLETSALADLATPLLAVALAPDESLPDALAPVDARFGGALGRAIARRDFRGARDETLFVAGADTGVERVLLVGLGKGEDRRAALRRAGAVAARAAVKLGTGAITLYAGDLDADGVEQAALGLSFGAWKYDDLKATPPENEQRAPLARASVIARADAQPG
ncbi:MAG: hypothetical protein M3154_11345, partial [Candidatus Eremiobacteraeota bacterium]|nr:hypothetical protein [Candidatus Eremiobacteraeota bacterium]